MRALISDRFKQSFCMGRSAENSCRIIDVNTDRKRNEQRINKACRKAPFYWRLAPLHACQLSSCAETKLQVLWNDLSLEARVFF